MKHVSAITETSRRLQETLGVMGSLHRERGMIREVMNTAERLPPLSLDQEILNLANQMRASDPLAVTQLKVLQTSLKDLPRWMYPVSLLQLVQSSWSLTAGLAAYGAARPSLIQDVLSSLHQPRPETITFETLVRSIEIADSDEPDAVEQALQLLRQSTDAILDLLGTCKDWFKRQGLLANITLLLLVIQTYDGHQSRLNSDDQTILAREQTALARAVTKSPTLQTKRELSGRVKGLEDAIARTHESASAPTNIRVLLHSAPLRKTPDGKGSMILRLYPDDQLLVTSVQGQWAHVDVYEYSKEKTVDGWVSRNALRLPRE